MKVILFDIDGTLLLTNRAGQAAIKQAVRELYDIENPAEVTIHGQTDRGIAGELFQAHNLAYTDEAWKTFRDCYVRHLAEQLPQRDGYVLPGVREILKVLDEREDTILGLLTGNIEDGARLKLEHYDLMHYFEFGGFGDHHPIRDDVAREAKKQAEAFAGQSIDPESVWVIGDTPNDIRCAKAIGARVLAVGTGGIDLDVLHSHEPDVLKDDLANEEEIISILIASSG